MIRYLSTAATVLALVAFLTVLFGIKVLTIAGVSIYMESQGTTILLGVSTFFTAIVGLVVTYSLWRHRPYMPTSTTSTTAASMSAAETAYPYRAPATPPYTGPSADRTTTPTSTTAASSDE